MNKKLGWFLILCAIAAYGVSLFLPAFKCPSNATLPGYHILAMGWMGIIGLDPRWYANITFVLMIVFSFKNEPAFISALTGGVLAVFSFAPAAGCGGDPSALVTSIGIGSGGLLWILAIFLAITGNFLITGALQQNESFPDTVSETQSKLGTPPYL
jgi:hypothetical protein